MPLHCLPTIEKTNAKQFGNYVSQKIDKTPFKTAELEDTIVEVQKILAQDPSLPRLTRGEIEELYEKVTREEYEKSLKAGDMSRADSMRALMLVLPYNTDNNTEENLQDLYNRPPVTKVIDVYNPPKHTQFATFSPNSTTKVSTMSTEKLEATTYKLPVKYNLPPPSPTKYNPPPPLKMFWKTTSPVFAEMGFRPMTSPIPVYNYALNAAQVAQTIKPNQRFSSHYSAKNPDFLKPPRPIVTTTTTTIKPMADILESYGIVGRVQQRQNGLIDNFVPAESAPQGVISTYVPQNINYGYFQQLYAQHTPPRVTPEAYSNFKPLNIGEEIRVKPEIEGYLTRFGIVANRKRKELNKADDEQNSSQDSEMYETKVLNGFKRARKGVENKTNGNSELDKLLENLKELDRLKVDPKMITTTSTPATTTTTIKSPPSSTFKTRTTTMRDLITNGSPLLIEAKKPVRRIDPNLDLNFGAMNNKQMDNVDQLGKLLENLQELQKLKLNPENVLKAVVSTTMNPISIKTTVKPGQTTAAVRAQTIINRFADINFQTQQQQLKQEQQSLQKKAEAKELEEVLRQIQAAEQRKTASTTEKAITTTTTKKSIVNNNSLGLNGLSQLKRLLGDDSELERLYNEARERAGGKPTTTTTTTVKPTTTKQPALDVRELQRYLELLDRPTTSSTTSTTTTAKPKPSLETTTTRTTTTEAVVKKSVIGNDQIFELINRVQELERAQTQRQSVPTSPTLPFLGFTSRNVKKPNALQNSNLYRSSNDFAQLQQLYEKVQHAEHENSFQGVDISTAKTQIQSNGSKPQNFAQRIIDITNDTGSGSSLQEVGPNEFVHLQKLLKKVQELERVKIGPNGMIQPMSPLGKSQREVPMNPTLTTLESATVGVYAVPNTRSQELITKSSNTPSVNIDLPIYDKPLKTDVVLKTKDPKITSSEELREFVTAAPVKSKNSRGDADFDRYQELFANLEDTDIDAYKNYQPPIIQKSITRETPRFIATRKPQDLLRTTKSPEQEDLKELQKLLSNAQELEKLGVTLPTQLSKGIETRLSESSPLYIKEEFKKIQIPNDNSKPRQNPAVDHYLEKYGILNSKQDFPTIETTSNEITTNGKVLDDDDADLAFISLTTIKPTTPKEIKTTTESAIQLPVFSATKIIEAAIKRAATKIGVSTENTLGFRRRSETELMDMETDNDLVAEFSELNYQFSSPDAVLPKVEYVPSSDNISEPNIYKRAFNETLNESMDISKDLNELQRLIKNLKELQALNISSSSQTLRLADMAYLESFKNAQNKNNETLVAKVRRQSETTTVSSIPSSTIALSTPTRLSLDLNLDDSDVKTEQTSKSTTVSSTTEESRNGAISDLEDSFGPDPNAEAEQPPKKKNGFYFLADWNSFLEVGDGDDKVVVRLSPKIGDPRLFLPVKIP